MKTKLEYTNQIQIPKIILILYFIKNFNIFFADIFPLVAKLYVNDFHKPNFVLYMKSYVIVFKDLCCKFWFELKNK